MKIIVDMCARFVKLVYSFCHKIKSSNCIVVTDQEKYTITVNAALYDHLISGSNNIINEYFPFLIITSTLKTLADKLILTLSIEIFYMARSKWGKDGNFVFRKNKNFEFLRFG